MAPICERSPQASSRLKGRNDPLQRLPAHSGLPRSPGAFPEVLIFFYGTLKRGHANHDRYCQGAASVEDASVRGSLFDLPFGFPALVVPEPDVRALGTGEPARDALAQERLNQKEQAPLEGSPRVYGELFEFEDPEVRLPAIDGLEGFDPERQSLYRRVLIPAETPERRVLAWAYAIERPSGTPIAGGRWPA